MSELGYRLKTAREDKGYSLDELQKRTKIQKRYLSAIEEGDFSKLPGEFYVRAFVKNYCEAVGINSDMAFEEHKDELPQPKQESADLPPRVNRPQPNMGKKKSKFASIIPTIVVVVFLLAIATWLYIFLQDNGDQTTGVPKENQQNQPSIETGDDIDDNNQENEEEPIIDEENEMDEEIIEDEPEPEPEPQVLELVSSEGNRSRLQLINADEFVVDMEFTGRSWMRILDSDGERIHEAEHIEGDQINFDFSEESEVTFHMGFVHTALLYVNDEILEYPLDNDTQFIIIEFDL